MLHYTYIYIYIYIYIFCEKVKNTRIYVHMEKPRVVGVEHSRNVSLCCDIMF